MSFRRRLEDRLERGLSDCMVTCLTQVLTGGVLWFGVLFFWRELGTALGIVLFLVALLVEALLIWWLLVREKD